MVSKAAENVWKILMLNWFGMLPLFILAMVYVVVPVAMDLYSLWRLP